MRLGLNYVDHAVGAFMNLAMGKAYDSEIVFRKLREQVLFSKS